MRNAALLAGFVVLVSMSPPIAVLADDGAAASITIRSYNTFTVSLRELDTTRLVARAVFSQAGIDARWRECRTALRRTGSDPCEDVLGAGEVIVRIVAAPGRPDANQSLGDSYIEPNAGSVLATVFGDRVHAAAARARSDAALLLGRAVAHEVGHLLVATARHSTRGLMRAWWSDEELRRDRERDWLFSPRQAERMREMLTARLRQQVPVTAHVTAPAKH